MTNVRNRFANEPDTYRSFLKILHTYQKVSNTTHLPYNTLPHPLTRTLRTITGAKWDQDRVGAGVAALRRQLFADHPDLLMDFTYFLPDAVQVGIKDQYNATYR